jgi:hypothetical protein
MAACKKTDARHAGAIRAPVIDIACPLAHVPLWGLR